MIVPDRVLRAAERVYRLLLASYPASFRRAWGDQLAEAFRDGSRDAARRDAGALVWFWLRAIGDLLGSAAAEHWTVGSGKRTIAWGSVVVGSITALGAGAFGWLCLHTDETGVLAMSVFLVAGALGLARPRQAWLAALIGLAAPGVQVLAHLGGWRVPTPNGPVPNPRDWSDVVGPCLALLFSTAGALIGALCGRIFSQLWRGLP
jgi:hypothetical protein